jgi:hypothetical protein
MWGYVQFSSKLPGRGREKFVRRPEEKVKWALRKIYYAEWAHHDISRTFSVDLRALGLSGENALRVKGWAYPPVIQTTTGLFEASYASRSGQRWHIRQDGLVWKESSEKPDVH